MKAAPVSFLNKSVVVSLNNGYNNDMGQEYRRTTTTVSLINYHFVFCPRYRRKILVNDVDRRFREILQELCDEHSLMIVALEIMPDHVHFFVNALPSISPSDIMAKVKGVTSRKLRQEFQHLQHLPSLAAGIPTPAALAKSVDSFFLLLYGWQCI